MRRKGFTLIELLVVIAIIAILAAILFPVFAQARMRANTMRCISNLKQLALAFQQYTQDYGGRMPAVGWEHRADIPNWCGEINRWIYPERGSLWQYTKSAEIYVCPVDKKKEALHPVVNPPTGKTRKDWGLSYSMNALLDYAKPDALNIKNPAKFMLLIHEEREFINDGIFVPDGNTPSKIHYDGTTLVYLAGNARWASTEDLKRERAEGYWLLQSP